MANEPTPPDDAPEQLERRLATILAADVAGYSRMMGEDEEATVQTLRGHRAIFDALLRQHHGRVFNTAGDAILAEFPSTVEAVRCATEIQAALETRNERLPPERKMLFRMGINVGDVVVQGGDLLGDGVNVAARIQTLAQPGGICISGSVYDQIQNKLSLQFRALGAQNLKNIAQPVRTFSITHGESGVLPARAPDARGKGPRAVAIATVVLGVIAGSGYWFYRDQDERHREEVASSAKLAAERGQAQPATRETQDSSALAATTQGKTEPDTSAAPQAQAVPPTAVNRRVADSAPKHSEAAAETAAAQAKPAAPPRHPAGATASPGTTAVKDASRKTAVPMPATSGVGAIDGAYKGQVCNFPQDAARRTCWRVPLQVQHGEADGTWTLRVAGKLAHMHAVIAPDGSVKATMDGWRVADGTPMTGAMNGSVANGHIDVEGRWSNGARVDGHWEQAR